MNYKKQFNELETTQQKRLFVLNLITDENYIRCLKFEKISLSTIEIAFKVFLGEKVVFKKTNPNIFKEHKTF